MKMKIERPKCFEGKYYKLHKSVKYFDTEVNFNIYHISEVTYEKVLLSLTNTTFCALTFCRIELTIYLNFEYFKNSWFRNFNAIFVKYMLSLNWVYE